MDSALPIIIFFFAHWFLSAFAQTFFLHRYASHRMFSMSKFWERFFYIFAFIAQGSSFLNPRAYAILHRTHHAYSDTEKDPHSPHHSRNIFDMMFKTFKIYRGYITDKIKPEQSFGINVVEWKSLDIIADSYFVRFGFIALYAAFYVKFAPSSWFYLLIPVHALMGPIHGAIVNWCGHKYGYVNHRSTGDKSRNTLPLDFLTLGELFQNNHHNNPGKPNFADRCYEVDLQYPLIWLMKQIGIIRFRGAV